MRTVVTKDWTHQKSREIQFGAEIKEMCGQYFKNIYEIKLKLMIVCPRQGYVDL